MKFKRFIRILVGTISLTLLCYGTTFATTNNQSSSKRYIIKFKTNGVNGSKIVSKHNGDFQQQFKHLNAAVADMKSEDVAALEKDSNVEYVEVDNPVKISETSKSLSTAQYIDWGVSGIKASTSQQSGLTGKGVKIAIIDTGVSTHPDLNIAGGTNVIAGETKTAYTDNNGHGTHIAGIIGGQGLNGGVIGVAPGASIYAVKALDADGNGYTSDIIAGIEWAIDNKIDIISLSFGSSSADTSLQNAVDNAYSNGVLIVAAAGNDGNKSGTGSKIEYPANYNSVIAVGAVDSSNTRAYFSSTGSKLEVSAPGVNIVSTYLNSGYEEMSGTSMATPFVAGDLALLKQKYPNYTNIQLRQVLDANVIDLGSTGRDSLYGYGLIQAPSNSQSSVLATPTASVAAGTYTSSQSVTLNDSKAGVSIYYTLDGSTPTSASNIYKSPITINSSKTLKAIAIDSNKNSSEVLSVVYVIVQPQSVVIPIPTASIPSGTYSSSQNVSLSDSKAGVSIYYTVDGTTPTAKSNLYSSAITISTNKTLKAIAIDKNGNSSAVLSAVYTISQPVVLPTPTASIPSGSYKTPFIIQLYCKYSKPLFAFYTLDGSTPTTKSLPYMGAINIRSTCTLKVIVVDSYGNTSGILSNIYTIIPPSGSSRVNGKSILNNILQTIILFK